MLLTALLAASLVGPSPCSPVGVPISRSSNDVFFIGAALPDTLLAGDGHHEWGTGPGHSGYGRARKIYGQLIQIEQIRGASRGRLPGGTRSVLLVPWDYGPDCRAVVWGESARWVPLGTRGVFRAILRPQNDWVNGIPTLDVFEPDFWYPSGGNLRYVLRDTTQLLPLEPVLDLYEQLPAHSLMEAAPDSAIQPLERWARQNPTLVAREPARTVLAIVRIDAEERRVSLIKSPIAGTYRFVVSVPHVDSQVVYARTEGKSWTTLRNRYEYGTPEDRAAGDSLIGYYLTTKHETSQQDLPKRYSTRNASPTISISLTPIFEDADSSVWHGGDDALDTGGDQELWGRAVRPRLPLITDLQKDDWFYMPGFWTTYRDGTVRYRNIVERNGVIIFSVVGERISREVMTRVPEDT